MLGLVGWFLTSSTPRILTPNLAVFNTTKGIIKHQIFDFEHHIFPTFFFPAPLFHFPAPSVHRPPPSPRFKPATGWPTYMDIRWLILILHKHHIWECLIFKEPQACRSSDSSSQLEATKSWSASHQSAAGEGQLFVVICFILCLYNYICLYYVIWVWW